MMSEVAEGSGRADGRRRRRLWSADEKRVMLAESFAPGASVAQVAQRYGVNATLFSHGDVSLRRRRLRRASRHWSLRR
jgi:transposase-like protein